MNDVRLPWISLVAVLTAVPVVARAENAPAPAGVTVGEPVAPAPARSEEHTSELQSRENLVCRLLLEKKKGSEAVAETGADRSQYEQHAQTHGHVDPTA